MSESSRKLSSLPLPPSTLSALARAGYETLHELQGSSAHELANELGISLPQAEHIFTSSQKPPTPSLTQSAASMAKNAQGFSTKSTAIDKLLSGGLRRGHILEISGPPGTPKEVVATNLVTSFVEAGHEVLFIDCQNMTGPAILDKSLRKSKNLPSDYLSLVFHVNIHMLMDLMTFMYHLPSQLDSHPKISLLVVNSISFPFHVGENLSVSARNYLLERLKRILTKACATSNLTVVTTSQLSTKILNPDGSMGTFNTGGKGIMVPQLGITYLPSGRSHRVIIAPTERKAGFAKLLSSPTSQPGSSQIPEVPYVLSEDGEIV